MYEKCTLEFWKGRTGAAKRWLLQLEQRQPDLTQWQTLVDHLVHQVEI